MDSASKELQEVKLELGKIKDEYRIKSEALEHLRKVNDDQAVRYEEAKFQMEKLAHELRTKEGEIAESRHLYEDVKHRMQETESSLKHASFLNEKLRVDSAEKVQRLEEENRKLISGLNEATLNTSELERQLCVYREEVAGLKVLVLDSQKKCLEAEQKIELKKALSSRDDAIMKLEEKCMDVQDQLKWKTEHFEHLKEAHKLLQENLESSKQEWALEKTTLLQEISSLQNNLDTQARLNENLQSELRMCNQALAHEESRRRTLEIQLSESKVSFENVLGEFNEAKSKIENLSMERDEKVAALRNTLAVKNAHVKEMEYTMSHLEQDNKDLLLSVKELQEAQIGRKKPDSSLIRLRNKIKDLEKLHNSCSVILEEREAEWKMKMENMKEQVTRCEFDLKTKTEEINQLKLQVESCQSSVDISVEEISILLMVLKSTYSEVYSELEDLKVESDMKTNEAVQQEIGSESQLKARLYPEQTGEEMKSLSKKIEALKIVETKNTLLETELDKRQKMLDTSAVRQLHLEEQLELMKASSKEMRNEVVGLQEEKTQVEMKLNTVEEHVELMEASIKQMRNEVVGLEKEKTQLERELKTREEHITLMEESAKQMMNDVVSLQKEKTQLERELKTAEEHVSSLEASSKQMRNDVIELEKEKTRLERELNTREEHFALMEGSAKQIMNEVVGLQEEKTQLERELKAREEHVALMEGSSKQVQHELDGLQKEKSQLEKELKESKEHVALMEASSKQMSNEVVGLEKQKNQLERELRAREEHVALMEGSSKQVQNEVDGLQKEKSQLEVELKTSKEHVSLVEASSKKMKNEVVGLEKEKKQLERELKTREEHAALIEASNKQMMNEVVDLQKEKARLEVELNTRAEHVTLIEASSKKMKSEVIGLQSEKNNLERELKTREEHIALIEASNKQLRDELVSLQKEKNHLESVLKTREEHVALMERSSTQMMNEAVGLRKEKTQLEKELKTRELLAKSDMENLEQAMEKLYTDVSISSFSETFEMLTYNATLREALVNAEYLIATEAQERNHLVSALEKEISDTRSELLHAEETVNYSLSRVKEQEAVLEQNALEISKLSSERECLVSSVEELYKQIGGFEEDDVKLMCMLNKMLGHCEEDQLKLTEGNIDGSEVGDLMKEDSFSNKGKNKGVVDRKVCPLRELN